MKKIAIVIGGPGGIGTALVHELVRRDWDVTVLTRRARPTGDRVTWYQGDVTEEADLRRIANQFAQEYGQADCIVYSAGLPPDVRIPLKNYPVADWNATFDTYVKGFLLSFQALLPHMRGGGHIVVMGSAITRFPSDSLPPIYAGHYAAAKAALSELVKWTRREAKEQGVLVSLVSPGAVDTLAHHTGDLAAIPKNLLQLKAVCDAILGIITAGIDAELNMVP